MLVSWDYIYKRRGWTVEKVLAGLDDKSWESFVEFHASRGIETPPKDLFDKLHVPIQKETAKSPVPAAAPKSAAAPVKKKRTYTRRKGTSNGRGKKGKE